jgi:hypothetical protein
MNVQGIGILVASKLTDVVALLQDLDIYMGFLHEPTSGISCYCPKSADDHDFR